jgi:GAF domain-containing protein
MNEDPDLRSAVAAGALGSERTQAALLTSIVEVARAIFGARASSIMLHDRATSELRFAAVAGEGSEHLIGTRIPDSTGIAGWVLTARQPIVLDDVASDPRFARDAAEATGFVPEGLMAVPLLLEDRVLGVLSVLDRPERSNFTLPEMDLLGHFAYQAALALELAEGARRAQAVLDGVDGGITPLAALADRIERLDDTQRRHALALIASLDALLGTARG